MIKRSSQQISNVICNELNYDEGKKNIVTFGLEVLIGGIIKVLIFFVTAYILDILTVALSVVITYVSIRWVVGGAHLSTYFRCLLISLSLIFATAYLAIYVSAFTGVETIILIVSMLLITLYSPVENSQNPLRTKKPVYKIYSIAVTAFYSILILMLNLPYEISLALSLGTLLAAVTITPIGVKLVTLVDTIFNKVTVKEV